MGASLCAAVSSPHATSPAREPLARRQGGLTGFGGETFPVGSPCFKGRQASRRTSGTRRCTASPLTRDLAVSYVTTVPQFRPRTWASLARLPAQKGRYFELVLLVDAALVRAAAVRVCRRLRDPLRGRLLRRALAIFREKAVGMLLMVSLGRRYLPRARTSAIGFRVMAAEAKGGKFLQER